MKIDWIMHFSTGQEHLYPTLEHYLGQAGFDPFGNPNVLDIGCGNNCIGEFTPLSKLYRDMHGLTLKLTCVDKTEEDFAIAQKALGGLVTFIPGDAQHIDKLVEGEYGLVLIRHPDVEVSGEQRIAWDNILRNSKNILNARGLVFMTHTSGDEYIHLVALLYDNEYNMLANEQNRYPGPILKVEGAEEEHRFDKFVVIGSK